MQGDVACCVIFVARRIVPFPHTCMCRVKHNPYNYENLMHGADEPVAAQEVPTSPQLPVEQGYTITLDQDLQQDYCKDPSLMKNRLSQVHWGVLEDQGSSDGLASNHTELTITATDTSVGFDLGDSFTDFGDPGDQLNDLLEVQYSSNYSVSVLYLPPLLSGTTQWHSPKLVTGHRASRDVSLV